MLFGLMLAYWVNYGFYFHPGAVQWRFPILFQAVFAIYILAVAPFLPDTPRWLMLHEATPEKGTYVLSKLRDKPTNDPMVQKEKNEILSAINIEAEEGLGNHFSQMEVVQQTSVSSWQLESNSCSRLLVRFHALICY
jgi:hypothetical protein